MRQPSSKTSHGSRPASKGSRMSLQAASDPLVTVVIPTYNRAGLVVRAVRSALESGSDDARVIVVDDASTDDTLQRLADVEDDRLQVLTQTRGGAPVARNRGAAAADTPWLLFLDSDDELLRDGLGHLTCCLVPDVGLASGDQLRKHRDGSVTRAGPWDLSFLSPGATALLGSGTYAVSTQLFLAVGGFDADLASAQHTDLAFRLVPKMSEQGLRILHLAKPIAVHHIGSPLSIRKDQRAVLQGTEALIQRHLALLKAKPRVLADYHGVAGVAASRSKEPARARRHFAAAVRYQPTSLKRWMRFMISCLPFGSRLWR